MSNFIISFDYELLWGLYGRKNYGYIQSNVTNSNLVADKILDIHDEFSFPATWAIVGLAADKKNRSENLSFFFDNIFKNSEIENKGIFKKLSSNTKLSYYGDIIDKIIATEDQELASHTYFHIFLDDYKTDSIPVKTDFEKFSELSQSLDKNVVSMIMPKNVYEARYAKSISDSGIKCVRINPNNFLYSGFAYKKPNKVIRLLRALDYYLPVNEIIDLLPQSRSTSGSESDLLHFTEATLFLRGSTKNEIINWIAYFRFIFAVRYRIFRKEDIHIWTHPHNFGKDIKQSLRWYKKMIMYAKKLEKKGLINTKSMKDLIAS
ncbi:polysaccharide deacetylase family protein [Cocleimonas flava]|uniref:Polysaccharide deacetylase n=1 Tax=Cocleimonas flava TaxID=634765 RepID=A0A4R1F5F7_9GAMM|nr:hypothetical protein [Cocleimonas flava]TCJ88640.1 hypothetical protein EV695_0498 [Cocleimonas flava]